MFTMLLMMMLSCVKLVSIDAIVAYIIKARVDNIAAIVAFFSTDTAKSDLYIVVAATAASTTTTTTNAAAIHADV